MKTSDFDYELPRELIAQHPTERRDQSRLLVLWRDSGRVEHRRFSDVGEYLRAGDVLVLNETEVIPARLLGRRSTGGRAEMFLLRDLGDSEWEVLVRPGAKIREGAELLFGAAAEPDAPAERGAHGEACGPASAGHARSGRPSLRARVVEALPGGKRRVRLSSEGDVAEAVAALGRVPLPPYIDREPVPDDRVRYQTVYARVPGAVAAPTAGLHFTEPLLASLASQGIETVRLTLHVGAGTFRPVTVENPEEHEMETERFDVPSVAADRINEARTRGGRVVAVGTTSVRALESMADEGGRLHPGSGDTRLFIRPPYAFKCVDALITNFHLPKSTLLMLVSAFGGREHVLAAYREAVARRYRFYSYGDAMLLL